MIAIANCQIGGHLSEVLPQTNCAAPHQRRFQSVGWVAAVGNPTVDANSTVMELNRHRKSDDGLQLG